MSRAVVGGGGRGGVVGGGDLLVNYCYGLDLQCH